MDRDRKIDKHGNVVNMPTLTNLSTIKVSINKQKKIAFQIIRPVFDVTTISNPHFDSKMGMNMTKLIRPKRATFQFVEEGKWSKQAEMIKFKVLQMSCVTECACLIFGGLISTFNNMSRLFSFAESVWGGTS